MPAPKKRGRKPLPANKQKGVKKCTACQKQKNMTDFYISSSPLFSKDRRVPLCKECIKDLCIMEDGRIDEIELNRTLRVLDKPYYKDSLESAYDEFKKKNPFIDPNNIDKFGEKILGIYFKNIGMKQDKTKSYSDSERDGFIHQGRRPENSDIVENEKVSRKYSDLVNGVSSDNDIDDDCGEFEVTDEIKELFGDGYGRGEYFNMYKKYEKLKINYSLQTNLHQEALATYVRFKVKEEMATAKGNVDEAKKWYDAAQNAAGNAKLTPKQLTKADLDGGVNSISELAKAVEQAVDVIKILPRFKYRPNDAPDFNLFCYLNYERDLNDKEPVLYEDVYKFYDERKRSYIEQNGDPYDIFTNDTSEKNRDNVKKFITLPDNYDDLAGDSNE